MTEQSNWKFIIPKETLTLETHLPNWYRVDVEKLHHQRFEDVAYLFATMVVSKDYEYFDKVKKFLKIPEKPKTLEEISQECEEKFDKHIESIKHKFAELKCHQEYLYNQKFNRIIENFEYAKEHGQFPVRLTIGNLDCSTLGVSSAVDWTTEFRIGKDVVGYWDIKPNIKVYLEKKPNRIVRYFSKLLLDFTWKDK
jgi:hypothetical protein